MRLARFVVDGGESAGLVDGDFVSDLGLSGASVMQLLSPGMWKDLAKMPVLRRIPLAGLTLLAPVPTPRKFLAIGLNYPSHRVEAAKAGLTAGRAQIWFNKQVTCINGPRSPIVIPRVSTQVDYEGELGVVMGAAGRYVEEADALSLVAGYVVINDVSVRDWQIASPTMTLGKSFDTHGPIGPWLVSPDEVGDPQDLTLEVRVNGEVRQRTSTASMVNTCRQQIAHLSKVFTLEAGDILATGTPEGVGAFMDPPRYLAAGDVVTVSISKLGTIENRVVAEAS